MVHVDLSNMSKTIDPVETAKKIAKKYAVSLECSTSSAAGILTIIFSGLENSVLKSKNDFELHFVQMVIFKKLIFLIFRWKNL